MNIYFLVLFIFETKYIISGFVQFINLKTQLKYFERILISFLASSLVTSFLGLFSVLSNDYNRIFKFVFFPNFISWLRFTINCFVCNLNKCITKYKLNPIYFILIIHIFYFDCFFFHYSNIRILFYLLIYEVISNIGIYKSGLISDRLTEFFFRII